MTDSNRRGAASVLLPGFVGTELPAWLERRLRAGLAGVCLFGENIVSPAQVRELTAAIRAANPRALIAIDEEGGDVTRLFFDAGSPYPGNAVLGRLDDPETTAAVAVAVADALRTAGVNLDFAPVVDVNANPDNPVIGVRSFGADAALVARHAATWVAAHEERGVATSAKHFPGHGDVAVDSHLALPVVDLPLEELRARELAPFRAAIAAGARTIMTSHILLPQLDPERPATFSPRILGELLRGELGFTGVIVSDALDMRGASGGIGIPEAAVRAIGGGCDLLCIGTRNTDAQLDEIESALDAAVGAGRLAVARLADAASRVAALAATLELPDARVAHVGGVTRPEPAGSARLADWPVGPERIAAAIEVRPGVRVAPGAALVQLETVTNIAVGSAPWGPDAAGASVVVVREGDPLPAGPLVLVGKDLHRHAWVRELVSAARAERAVVTVDMGWPAPDRALVDIATFGASRAVGAALLEVLARLAGDPEGKR